MEVKTNNKKPANKKTAKKKSSNLVGKNSKTTKAKPTTKSVRKISAIKPIPADIFSDKKRVIVKEVDTGGETIIAAEQATAKFTPVKTKKNSKISQALERARVRAEKNYAIAAAKAKLAEERANARDEQALAIEIDNAETLITDENSVIDPLTANENAQLNYVNEIKIAPVSSIEINGVNVDVSSKHAKKKIAKIRRKTNWHKKLYFIAPAISVAAIACALTPIAIVKPIKALQPVITMDDDSSEGVVVKSQNVHINKDSTITLSTRDEERITNVDIKMHDQSLNSDQYSFDQMSNVVTIKASAMTTVDDIKLKVVTDLPRFEPKFEPTTKGISNVTFSSKYASFRKAFVITCDIKDGYVLDQDALTSGLVLTVGDRQLTDPNEVEIKPVNDSNTKYTITIKPGIVNDAVKLSGEITKYNVKIQKDATAADNYVASCHNGFETTVGKIADIQDVVTLENSETRKGYKPQATVTVDNNGAKIPLEVDSDYVIKSVWRDNAYHYDLIWTDNGKQKILGPVTIDLKASTNEIKWKLEEQFKDPKWADIAVGMNSRNELNFKATVENGAVDVKDVKIIKGANLGYALNEDLELVPLPGIIQSTGTITVQARIDELIKTVDVNVIEPYITISGGQKEVKVEGSATGYKASVIPSYIMDEEIVKSDAFKWKSDDDHILKLNQEGETVTVTGIKKGITSITASTVMTNPTTGAKYNCFGKYRIDAVMYAFSEASWKYVMDRVTNFYDEFYKEGATDKDKENAMKKLCDSFQDTPYIENIDSNINDSNKKVEEHLSNFIGKEKTVNLKFSYNEKITGYDHNVRIIGINHDAIVDKDSKGNPGPLDGIKALFTFDSVDVVTIGDGTKSLVTYFDYYPNWSSGSSTKGQNWWFCADQYAENENDKRISVLYKALNSTQKENNIWWTSLTEPWHTETPDYNKSVYVSLKEFFEKEDQLGFCPIKYVSKCVGMKKSREYIDAKSVSEYSVENYDAYCFPLTTAEINMDQSKVKVRHPTRNHRNGIKNEGEPYKMYLLDKSKLKKGCTKNRGIKTINYLLASPIFSDPRSDAENLGRFAADMWYWPEITDWKRTDVIPWITGSKMDTGKERNAYESCSFAFCI